MSGISKSSESKLCKDIDERLSAFLKPPLIGEWPYLWLDVTYVHSRVGEVGRWGAFGWFELSRAPSA